MKEEKNEHKISPEEIFKIKQIIDAMGTCDVNIHKTYISDNQLAEIMNHIGTIEVLRQAFEIGMENTQKKINETNSILRSIYSELIKLNENKENKDGKETRK